MKMKQMIELTLPIIGMNNKVIGTYNKRFKTPAEAQLHVFELEAKGMRLSNNYKIEIVDVKDESQLQ